MGKSILFFIPMVLISASLCFADYINPPDWFEDEYFTHQSWEFDSDQATDLMPDGGYINPFGDPLFNIDGDDITWAPEVFGRYGVWIMRSGQASIDIFIPNEEDRQLYKEVWLQMILRTAIGEEDILQMLLSPTIELPTGQYEVSALDYSFEPVTEGDIWYCFTAMYRIDPQPGWEKFIFDFEIPQDRFFKLDELDIDTHCVPEPSLAILLLAGCAALASRKRR